MAGQEGFEPTTHGFGIRCSTVGATALNHPPKNLLTFFVNGVLATELAVLLQLKLIGSLLLVLARLIIFALAVATIQTNADSHNSLLFSDLNDPLL